MTPQKLEQLFVGEVSAVDDPANEIPGWMVAKSASESESATSLLGKIRDMLTQSPGKDDIDMTSDELTKAIDERLEAFGEKIVEKLSKSVVPTPAPEGAPAPVTDDSTEPTLTVEDVAKAIEAGLEPVLEVIDKALDRVTAVEQAYATRKSLDGQEDPDGAAEEVTPNVQDAIRKALRQPQRVAA